MVWPHFKKVWSQPYRSLQNYIFYNLLYNVYLIRRRLWWTSAGQTLSAALGELSSHAKRELLMADYHNFFITNFPMTARLTRQTTFAIPKLAKLHFYIIYYLIRCLWWTSVGGPHPLGGCTHTNIASISKRLNKKAGAVLFYEYAPVFFYSVLMIC